MFILFQMRVDDDDQQINFIIDGLIKLIYNF